MPDFGEGRARTPATMKVVSQLFFACPVCGDDEAFQIHDDQEDRAFAHRNCRGCGATVAGRYAAATRSVDITAIKPGLAPIPGYMLLRLWEPVGPKEETVWLVVRETCRPHAGFTFEQWLDNRPYYVNEHTCPTNLVPAEAIYVGGDSDPHGVFQFVAFAPSPDLSEENDYDWSELFPQLSGGAEIEGEAVEVRFLPGAAAADRG